VNLTNHDRWFSDTIWEDYLAAEDMDIDILFLSKRLDFMEYNSNYANKNLVDQYGRI
jgi:hypothetical protein